jgi:hypothetical protein
VPENPRQGFLQRRAYSYTMYSDRNLFTSHPCQHNLDSSGPALPSVSKVLIPMEIYNYPDRDNWVSMGLVGEFKYIFISLDGTGLLEWFGLDRTPSVDILTIDGGDTRAMQMHILKEKVLLGLLIGDLTCSCSLLYRWRF